MNLYETSIPTYHQSLKNLSAMLDKAAARTKGEAMLNARLADDMHPLSTQIRFVANIPGEALERLTGRSFTSLEESPTSFAQAKQQLADMEEYLGGFDASDFKDGQAKVVLNIPNGMEFTLTTQEYLRDWSLPNFYFHLTAAYAILRAEAVDLGKADFLAHMFKYSTKMPSS